MKFGFSDSTRHVLQGIGLLILRVSVGLMLLLGHGWPKLSTFGDKAGNFPDPLGVGSAVSLALATFAEFLCSLAVILGFATRLAAIPVVITMAVAVFMIHAEDPWQRKEFALLYLVPFFSLIFTGAGPYSIDRFLAKDKSGSK